MEQRHAQAPLHHDYKLQRLIVLTDAVFAIAMTLLALELRLPETWDGTVAGLFSAMSGSLVAYVVSFFVVAGYWSANRRSFGFIVKADGVLTLLSLLALGLVTLLPIVTRFMTAHGGNRSALAVYLGLFAAIGVVNALAWAYACLKPGLLDPSADGRFRLTYLFLQLAPLVTCCAVIFANLGKASIWRWSLVALLFVGLLAFRRWRGRPPKPVEKEAVLPPAPPASPVDRHADDGLKDPAVGA